MEKHCFLCPSHWFCFQKQEKEAEEKGGNNTDIEELGDTVKELGTGIVTLDSLQIEPQASSSPYISLGQA